MNLASLWDTLVLAVCRPPRDLYAGEDDLVGGRRAGFRLGNRRYYRQDVELINKRGLKLHASHYRPCVVTSADGRLPAVVYCHCNSGSRRDAEEILYHLLPKSITVFALDFAGSGMSEGEYVTLGAHEVEDLAAAVAYLREEGSTSTIGLWGRSMGAVTALLYSQRDPSIGGMVLDSPFSRLSDLMMELATDQQLRIPKPLIKVALAMMRRSVRKRAGFSIDDVAPLDHASESYCPALFGHAREDTFVNKHHSERLFAAHSGDKNFITFDGDHNSVRPEFFYDSALIFLLHALRVTELVGPDLDLESAEDMRDLPRMNARAGSMYITSSLTPAASSAAGSAASSQPASPQADGTPRMHRTLTAPWDRASLPGHSPRQQLAAAAAQQQQQQGQQPAGAPGAAGGGPGAPLPVRAPGVRRLNRSPFASEDELASMEEEAALQQALEASLRDMKQQEEQQQEDQQRAGKGGGEAGEAAQHRRLNPLFSSSLPTNPVFASGSLESVGTELPHNREEEEAMLAQAIQESLRISSASSPQPQPQQQVVQQQEMEAAAPRQPGQQAAQPLHPAPVPAAWREQLQQRPQQLTHGPRVPRHGPPGQSLAAQHAQQEAEVARAASAELQHAYSGVAAAAAAPSSMGSSSSSGGHSGTAAKSSLAAAPAAGAPGPLEAAAWAAAAAASPRANGCAAVAVPLAAAAGAPRKVQGGGGLSAEARLQHVQEQGAAGAADTSLL